MTQPALIKDGKLIATIEEERFNRVRHSKGFPRMAIAYCLKEAGIEAKDIDIIAIGYHPWAIVRRGFFFLDAWSMIAYFTTFFLYRWGVRELQKASGARLVYVEHHRAHAATAYRCSTFTEANVITIDGAGETETAAFFEGRGGKLTLREEIPFAHRFDRGPWHSIGKVYTRVTSMLKLGGNAEGKTMGLASYGEPHLDFSDILNVKNWNDWKIDRRNLKKFEEKYGRKNEKDPLTQAHKDLAASVQKALEEALLALARDAYGKTGIKNFALAGGCALNCNANSYLLEQDFCDAIFVQPASHDGGIALGAALEVMHEVGDGDFVPYIHAYWGEGYSNEQIEKVLKEAKAPYRRSAQLEADTARLVAQGKIVGWFQGRSELGPRALGNRSILANPQIKGMNDKVNVEVKHREVWRPFAPSVTKEDAPKYFKGLEKMDESPFMLQTHYVRDEYRTVLPAITHVDGSSRIQTVTKEQNPRYYALLKAFEKESGHPVVMNTSFNDAGEPIVQTPKDALKCFYGTGFDALVMGDFILEK